MNKTGTERNLRFPSVEFRDKIRTAAKERGFRSEQAFILSACTNELRRGKNDEAATQFEARVAATLTNHGKEIQALQTLGHAQLALTDSLIQYVLTCLVEPPADALPAARARAKERYRKLLLVTAAGVKSKNSRTVTEVMGHDGQV